jgi:hypothetical protein
MNEGAERYYENPVNFWQIARRLMSPDDTLHSELVRTAASVPVRTVLPLTSVCISVRLVFEALLITKLVLIVSFCFSTGRHTINVTFH